ncbi:MAG: DUF2090 domain-containing protein [Candidatus Uhrbacteria bacterium]
MHGYTKPLAILPFDHRSFLTRTLFNKTKDLTEEEKEIIKEFKKIIYQGFLKGIEMGVPQDEAAILVDEEYGADLLADARKRGIVTILTTEKSGTELFEFQYGDDFDEHIETIKPTFAKVLLHYRADGDVSKNQIQLERIKLLADWCIANEYGLLMEPLISPTEAEKNSIGQERFDNEIRPGLTVELIKQFHAAGIEVDVWKIEGFNAPEAYRAAVAEARADGRDDVGCVVLGRSETEAHVDGWIKAGKGIDGMIGFAVGRTIFWDALDSFHKGQIDRETAIGEIAENYLHFYEVFSG